jgi:hypothetical protein
MSSGIQLHITAILLLATLRALHRESCQPGTTLSKIAKLNQYVA